MKVKDLVFKKIKIRVQLLIVLTVCITLFSFLILFSSEVIAKNIVNDNLERITYTLQYGSGNELNLFFRRIATSANLISQNKEIERFLNGDDNIDISQISDLNTLDKNEIESVVVCRDGSMSNLVIYGEPVAVPRRSTVLKSKAMKNFLDADATYQNAYAENFLLLVTYCDYGNGGYLLTYVKEPAVADIISKNRDTVSARWLNEDNCCISSSVKSEIGTVLDITATDYEKQNAFSFALNDSERETVVTRIPIEMSGKMIKLVYDVNGATIWNNLYMLDSVTIVIAVLMLLSLIGITVWISTRVVSPIERLNRHISHFDGKPDHTENRRKYNEIVELADTYEKMTDRIAELIEKNNRDMERQRALELAALQIQINPHFLYNTLDTVAWLSKMRNQPDIEKLVVSLARFFRISLHKGDKYIRVYEEIELLKNYVNIENIRFPEKIKLNVNISDDIKFSRMLKIILQPIVEDSMKHGFSHNGTGNITINGFREGKDLIFEIIDDGVGFEVPEDFLKTKEPAPKDGTGGYGLKNVDERIKLEYGDEYGLSFKSKPGFGTRTTVRIKDMPEEDYDDIKM